MPSAPGLYDETLLATAPATTKAQTQAGYSTDLLNPPQGTATPPLSSPHIDVERGLAYKEYNGVAQKSNPFLQFFRTRKGKMTIVVLIIVVLAAIIGGAVGGSTHNHKNSDIGSIGSIGGNGTSLSGPFITTSASTSGSQTIGITIPVSGTPSSADTTTSTSQTNGLDVSTVSSSSSGTPSSTDTTTSTSQTNGLGDAMASSSSSPPAPTQ